MGLMSARGKHQKRRTAGARVTAPARVAAQASDRCCILSVWAGWSDERVLAKVREMVLPQIERHGAISAWIIDDTSFPSGTAFGRRGAGSIPVNSASRTIAKWRGIAVAGQSPCRACRSPTGCICPQEWASDRARRRKAGVARGDRVQRPSRRSHSMSYAGPGEAGLPRGVVLL